MALASGWRDPDLLCRHAKHGSVPNRLTAVKNPSHNPAMAYKVKVLSCPRCNRQISSMPNGELIMGPAQVTCKECRTTLNTGTRPVQFAWKEAVLHSALSTLYPFLIVLLVVIVAYLTGEHLSGGAYLGYSILTFGEHLSGGARYLGYSILTFPFYLGHYWVRCKLSHRCFYVADPGNELFFGGIVLGAIYLIARFLIAREVIK